MSESQTIIGQCQSCGMPMSSPEQFGSNIDGSVNEEYCIYCFQDGDFTMNVDKETFIAMQVKIAMEKMGMDEAQARTMANNVLPTLKRWKES
jgi:hypothetical protein